ncbi:hypothetical protein C8R43DRAFT_226506 [Mycena crocata]|nr:hypothetical protein C8R43DRAFT_226506 [Mycena crocata]
MPPVLNIPRFAHLRKLSLQSRDLAVFLQQPAFLAHLESLDVSMALIHLLECDVLDALSPIHQHPNISISIHLHRFNILAPASVFNTMERCIDFALAMGTRWDGVFGRVRNLTLGDAGCNNLSASREFSRWLGLFPAAETVSWDDYSTVAGPSLRTRQIAQKVDRHVLNGAVSAVLVAPTSASGTASNFLSLPDDIILAFFEYLSDELFDLSLVSRRLNFLALPVCLSREDIVDRLTGQYTVLIGPYPRARDALAALNVALFLPSVKSLHCHISRALHIYPLLNHLRRLISFMERLPSVGEVSLQFGTTDSTPPLTHYDPLQYQWCALFEQLLNIIVAKSCVSLSVNGSPYLFPSHMTWKARILDEHKKKINSTLTPSLD